MLTKWYHLILRVGHAMKHQGMTMLKAMASSKLLLVRRISKSMKLPLSFASSNSASLLNGCRLIPLKASQIIHLPPSTPSRSFCSPSFNVQGPTTIDYRYALSFLLIPFIVSHVRYFDAQTQRKGKN